MFNLVLGSFLVSLMPLPLGLAWGLLARAGARLKGRRVRRRGGDLGPGASHVTQGLRLRRIED